MKIDNNLMLTGLHQQATSLGQVQKTEDFQKQLELAIEKQEDKELQEACKQFEAFFIQQLWKEMRSTLSNDGLIPKSQGEEIFQEMLDAEYAKEATNNEGIGLAKMLYEQLRHQTTAE